MIARHNEAVPTVARLRIGDVRESDTLFAVRAPVREVEVERAVFHG
jgi:hypothetical protein